MLKLMMSLLVVTLLWLSVISSNVPTCLALNPFLPSLSSKGVKVLPSPDTSVQAKCGDEWKQHGTCCETLTLTAYAIKDGKKIDVLVTATKLGVKLAAKLFVEVLDFAESLKSKQLQPKAASFRDEILRGSLASTRPFLESIGSPTSDFSSSLSSCWAWMKMVRSNSLCSICAGNSARHFEGGKVLVSPQACYSVLDRCAVSFKYLIGISEILDDFNNIIRVPIVNANTILGKLLKKFSNKFRLVNANIIEKHQKNRLTVLLDTFIAGLRNQSAENRTLQAELCSKLLNIQLPTFLEQSIGIYYHFPKVLLTTFRLMKAKFKIMLRQSELATRPLATLLQKLKRPVKATQSTLVKFAVAGRGTMSLQKLNPALNARKLELADPRFEQTKMSSVESIMASLNIIELNSKNLAPFETDTTVQISDQDMSLDNNALKLTQTEKIPISSAENAIFP